MSKKRCYSCMCEFDASVDSSICPYCGYDQNTPVKEAYHLDPGTHLNGRYLIGKSLGAGGFGITYIAWDEVLQQKVAIKEYLPSEFGTRLAGTTEVCAYDGEKKYQFESGLKSFVDEALRLVKYNNLDGIVHIFDSFVSNNTAYIIMEFIDGETLISRLKREGPLPYEEVVKIVIPVLRSLEEVHKDGIIHRDIAPDNIMITKDGKVKLIDFGAARNATTVHSKSLSVLIKPGYAPEEQYRSSGKQGPWTDVYAMAATMYHAITGKLPPEALERKSQDELKTPTKIGFPMPENLENAIMNALNVKAEYRVQSASDFADALSGATEVKRVKVKQVDTELGKWSKKTKIAISSCAAVAIVLIVAIFLNSTGIVSFTNSSIIMPDCIGKMIEVADDSIEKVGLEYKIVGQVESDEEAGKILYQSIQSGSKLSEGDTLVQLKISEGKKVVEDKKSNETKMPNVLALNREEVISKLKTAGISNYEFKEEENDQYEAGLACRQSVTSGTKIDKKTKVVIYIAKEVKESSSAITTKSTTTTEKVTTKKTTNKTTTTTKKPTTAKKTTVKKTTKAAVNMVTVPNITGETVEGAISRLSAVGLQFQFNGGGEIVIGVDPPVGEAVPKGTVIKITLE